MEKKEALLFSDEHVIVRGNLTKTFVFQVYTGLTPITCKFHGKEHMVDVKAFRIFITETWKREEEVLYETAMNLGYVTQDSGRVAHLIRLCKEQPSISDMIQLVVSPLRKEYRAGLEKCAVRNLKKQLRPHLTATPLVRTNKKYHPIPQIVLPWEKK